MGKIRLISDFIQYIKMVNFGKIMKYFISKEVQVLVLVVTVPYLLISLSEGVDRAGLWC